MNAKNNDKSLLGRFETEAPTTVIISDRQFEGLIIVLMPPPICGWPAALFDDIELGRETQLVDTDRDNVG
jgi:hypothetical protein